MKKLKKVFTSTVLAITIILAIINIIFLIETSKNPDLSNLFYKNIELPLKYSPLEITHMQEVKQLVINSIIINLGLIVLLSYTKKHISTKLSGNILLSIIILTIFSLLVSFNSFFINFHKLIFNTNTWLLPSDSILIQSFPETYFKNISYFITTILTIISILLIKLKKRNIYIDKVTK